MATDTFAKIGDIKGESQDDKHKEEINDLMRQVPKLCKKVAGKSIPIEVC